MKRSIFFALLLLCLPVKSATLITALTVNTNDLATNGPLALNPIRFASFTNLSLPIVTVSPNPWDYTNNVMFGPWTPETTTSGIQEAMAYGHALGGANLVFQAGIYLCSGAILEPDTTGTPLMWHGVSAGSTPGTIFKYSGSANFIQTTAPDQTSPAVNWIWDNISVTSEAVTTNFLFQLFNVGALAFERCTFAGWDYYTNYGFNGGIGSGGVANQANGLVGFQIGRPDHTDFTLGVAQFTGCRFWFLNSGGFSCNDHTWFQQTSFSHIGGGNKLVPGPTLWPIGETWHFPESALALHPGWIDYSLWNDYRFIDCSFYYVFLGLLCGNEFNRHHRIFSNKTLADLEASAWLVGMYDDNPAATIDIYGAPSTLVQNDVVWIHKPATLSTIAPANFKNGLDNTMGATNVFIAQATPFGSQALSAPDDTGVGPRIDANDISGRNIFRGNTILDKLSAGVSVDLSHCTVTGGSDAGINGIYYLAGYAFDPVGFNSGRTWTNATFRIMQFDADTGFGGFFTLSDTNFSSELYFNDAPAKWADNAYIAAAGVYAADQGTGTPPTVAFALYTNATYFAGPVTISQSLTATNIYSSRLTNSDYLEIGKYLSLPTLAGGLGANPGLLGMYPGASLVGILPGDGNSNHFWNGQLGQTPVPETAVTGLAADLSSKVATNDSRPITLNGPVTSSNGIIVLANANIRWNTRGTLGFNASENAARFLNTAGSQASSINNAVRMLTKTANYTLNATTDCNTYVNNSGASGAVTNTLPTAAANLQYGLIVVAAQNLAFKAQPGDTIRYGSNVSASGGLIFASTQGMVVHVVAVAANLWYVDHIIPITSGGTISTDWTVQ